MTGAEKGVGLEPHIKGAAETTTPVLPIDVHPSRQQ